jgi:DNA-directed RNA polymerase II subunit RPB1
MYPVQDTVIGSFILTRMDTFIKRQYFFDYVMTIRYASKPIPKPAIMYRTESGKWESLYTGVQLVNYLTPPKIFFQKGVRDFDPEGDRFEAGFSDPDQRLVVVHDGDVCMGKLCKGTIGGCANGFIQRIHYMHGNWRAAQWISDLQRVVATWFPSHGFSIGLEDCLPSEEIERKVGIVVKKSIEAIKRGTKLAREKGVSEERIEQQCMKVASSVMSQSARVILNSVDRKNNILQCIQSGAKGKPMNICQILGVLGQQVSSGKRIFDLYNSKGRTLSCYDDEDADDPISHGLVTGSYRDGLACESYFFHCMTGREGLIDTACKTAETGYLQRRVIKVLESVYAASDGSVRDGADGNLISTRYAGDGQDPEKLVQVPVPILKKTGDPLAVCEAWCRGSGEEALTLSRIYAKVRHILNKNKNNRGRLYLAFDAEVEIPMPSSDVPPITWEDLKGPIERACCKLARIVGERRSVMHMELSIRTSFAATRLGRVTPTSVKAALESIVSRVERAKIAAGSSIGTLAGTSIGEPATQMTLNTFHAAGTGNVTVSRGVPRFKELIDLSKNPATPSLRIYLNPSLRSDVDIATRLAHDLPGKYLKDFVERMELVLDEDPTTSTIEGDRCMVEVHNSIAPPVAKADWSRWIARLVLKKKKMVASNLTVAHVRSALRANFGEKIRVITSQPMDEEWICRVRISKTANALKLEKLRDLADHERMNLEKLALDEIMVTMVEEARICGISSIKQAFVSKKQGEYVIDTDGTSLEQVLSSGDLIDYRRCTSNSIHESFKCLGVEAAQNVIRLETQDVINDSGDVHVGHLDLLSQKMNVAGQPLPVTRHGMKRGQTGVLAAASFERTVDTFLHAAVHSETDRAGGVTESIVLGRLTRMGTGSVRLVHDKEMLKKIAAKKMSDQNVKLRFIGRKKGGYRKRRTVFWDFTSDPIHRVHVVQDSMRRVFTPPPVSSFADEDEPMTPPTDDDEDMLDCSAGRCETPPPATMMFGRWPIQMLMPQKPVWTIRMPMPKVVVVSQS